tara:strand:- start:29625 stop:30167 length:543 start_codon:yes stop_codon:yes gene_type:complete
MIKTIYIAVIAIFTMTIVSQAQIITNENFESLEAGQDILKLKKGKFNTWGKSTWTVTEQAGGGFHKSDKFASSGGEENATLAQSKKLEVGETYVFSVAVKMTDTGGQGWKSNYSVKVISGGKADTHIYKGDNMKEPGADLWKQHKIEFTVVEGREKVTLQVYRWAPGTILNIDDFKIKKK